MLLLLDRCQTTRSTIFHRAYTPTLGQAVYLSMYIESPLFPGSYVYGKQNGTTRSLRTASESLEFLGTILRREIDFSNCRDSQEDIDSPAIVWRSSASLARRQPPKHARFEYNIGRARGHSGGSLSIRIKFTVPKRLVVLSIYPASLSSHASRTYRSMSLVLTIRIDRFARISRQWPRSDEESR